MGSVILYGSDGGVLKAVAIDSAGHLQVDALTLPSGLATEASLQKLVNALATVATDKLRASILDLVKGDWLSTLPVVKGDWLSALPALVAGTANIGKVDVNSSALPTGAATAANQATEITALQLIDDLRNALATVAADSLRATLISPTAADNADNLAAAATAIRVAGLLFGFDGTYWDRLRTWGTGILKVGREGIGAAVSYLSSSGSPASGARKVWWYQMANFNAAADSHRLRDGTSGAGTLKLEVRIPPADSKFLLFDPPIECTTGIYVEYDGAVGSMSVCYT